MTGRDLAGGERLPRGRNERREFQSLIDIGRALADNARDFRNVVSAEIDQALIAVRFLERVEIFAL